MKLAAGDLYLLYIACPSDLHGAKHGLSRGKLWMTLRGHRLSQYISLLAMKQKAQSHYAPDKCNSHKSFHWVAHENHFHHTTLIESKTHPNWNQICYVAVQTKVYFWWLLVAALGACKIEWPPLVVHSPSSAPLLDTSVTLPVWRAQMWGVCLQLSIHYLIWDTSRGNTTSFWQAGCTYIRARWGQLDACYDLTFVLSTCPVQMGYLSENIDLLPFPTLSPGFKSHKTFNSVCVPPKTILTILWCPLVETFGVKLSQHRCRNDDKR